MRKREISLIASVIFAFCLVALNYGIKNELRVAAIENERYFTDEEYTGTDRLLLSNGEYSNKVIKIFANEVKNLANGDECPEITQVIPRQYMESTEQNAVFKYNGKEYGFYVVKTGSRFDVLLTDFCYEFNNNKECNNEYVIKISPLLQQTFVRSDNGNGGYVYKKLVSKDNYKYYVANPRFAVGLKNEHSLNFGDYAYDKRDDKGPIIQQTRVNYGKVGRVAKGDYRVLQSGFAAVQTSDYAADKVFECADYSTFGVANLVEKIIKSDADDNGQVREITARANSETNVFTNLSKTDQLNNSEIKGFSRAAYFMPENDLFLSADEGSYAEFVTVLNDINESCRLMRVCDFDIVKCTKSTAVYVDGYNADNAFTAYRESVLFEKTYEPENGSMPYYLNKNGSQIYTFNPEYTGRYTIDTYNGYVGVKINGEKYVSTENLLLERGKNYKIEFVADRAVDGEGSIKLSNTSNDTEIAPINNYVMKFRPANTGIYRISAEGAKVSVHKDIFGTDEIVTQSDNGELNAVLQSGVDYYMVADNSSSTAIKMLTVTEKADVTKINCGEHTSIQCKAGVYEYFAFYAPYAGKYDFVFSSEDIINAEIKVIAADNTIITADKGISNDKLYLSDLSMGNNYYFVRVYSSIDMVIDCYVNS